MVKNLSQFQKSKNNKFKNLIHIRAIKEPIFLTFNDKKVFNILTQVFLKALIF